MSSANPRQDLHRNAAIRGVILSAPIPIGTRRTSAESTCNHVCLNGDISGSMQARARPADSPCETVICLVYYFPYKSLAALLLPRRLPFITKRAPQIAQFLCNLTPLESALPDHLVSAENKGFIQMLSLLECALTKNRGRGVPLASAPSHPVPRHSNPLPEESRCVLTP
jgi:hypothetical protein